MAKIGHMEGFIQTIMDRAIDIYYYNHKSKDKMRWDYLICNNPTDVAIFHLGIDMNILLKYIKNAIKAEKDYLKRYNIKQKFTIRFIDAYKYDGNKVRKPTLKEKADFLSKLMKLELRYENLISSENYRSQRGKLYSNPDSFQEVINFLNNRKEENIHFSSILEKYNNFIDTGIKYWDENELKHIKNPTIIGSLDVDISFKNHPHRNRGKGGKYKHVYHN